MRLRDFEKKEIFEPLGMNRSTLGMGSNKNFRYGRGLDFAECGSQGHSAIWPKSAYWRDIGHPRGGMHSTTPDFAVLLQTFLNGGVYDGNRILVAPTVKAMTADQNLHLQTPWGLAWALGRSIVWNFFCDLTSASTSAMRALLGRLHGQIQELN